MQPETTVPRVRLGGTGAVSKATPSASGGWGRPLIRLAVPPRHVMGEMAEGHRAGGRGTLARGLWGQQGPGLRGRAAARGRPRGLCRDPVSGGGDAHLAI